MSDRPFIEVDFCQAPKSGQPVAGDVFLSRKVRDEQRIVSVLADGLGSGVKANVLATLTSTMALNFVARDTDIRETAKTIMDTLPVCSERKIGYSTFTIVDIEAAEDVRIIEHDNPPCLTLRNGAILPRDLEHVDLPPSAANPGRERRLAFSHFQARKGDRIVTFSDGVSQSGMGQGAMLLGWGVQAVTGFLLDTVQSHPRISARELAERVVSAAASNDDDKPKDDITCSVIYFRQPRRLLMVTGPPFAKQNDSLMAQRIAEFDGAKVVCGGTTASIVARELDRPVSVNIHDIDPHIPPTSRMPGVDLITEGTITLAKVAEMLEHGDRSGSRRKNGSTQILEKLLNSDTIEFIVGTRINEAHQDPNTPVELDFRRNLMKRIRTILEEKYLKETTLQFV